MLSPRILRGKACSGTALRYGLDMRAAWFSLIASDMAPWYWPGCSVSRFVSAGAASRTEDEWSLESSTEISGTRYTPAASDCVGVDMDAAPFADIRAASAASCTAESVIAYAGWSAPIWMSMRL